eukprot:TRINITY_DN4451_c2_g1_i1.p1 TRINITY_DN4451_c2_g1~~TRINITY_DN4451_c2_g1_i1.p1  ORF type:complete len:282 (-),score=68.18 TRINITY_DN4451_c2_g1_i1:98-943(-)
MRISGFHSNASASLLVLVVLLATSSTYGATFKSYYPCDTKTAPGTFCTIAVNDLRPTQFGVGMDEVDCKRQRFESMSLSDLEDYLLKASHSVPVTVSPSGDFYLSDHHHMARALSDANVPKSSKIMLANVTDNWNKITQNQFWQLMLQNNKMWLYDEKGMGPISPLHLPRHVDKLQDDFFRSLAFFVKHAGGYGKTTTDFSDFQWANFLRSNMTLPKFATRSAEAVQPWTYCAVIPYADSCIGNHNKLIQAILDKAVAIAKSPIARSLPGWGQGTVDPANC